jgi:hypothetical protein
MTLDFAYTLYLILNSSKEIDKTQIKRFVSKWYVLTTLTGRYISSPEMIMDSDIKKIKERGFPKFLSEIEEASLSDVFWEVGLVQALETSAVNSPYINVFLAAQIHNGDNSLFMNGCKVRDLITTMGDVHHIFPKAYLQKNGLNDKSVYNQIANLIFLDTSTNNSISDKPPKVYFIEAIEQCNSDNFKYGNITDIEILKMNIKTNCIPWTIHEMQHEDFQSFLIERRKLMALKIRSYYYSL